MKKDTLYVSDLDGTLLGTDSRISARTAATVSELTSRGALITVATARTPATVVPILEQTRTTPPAVVITGTAYWDRRAGRFTDVHLVDGSDVEACSTSAGSTTFILSSISWPRTDARWTCTTLHRC